MQDALLTVLIVVVVIAVVVAVYTLAGTGRSLREIGSHGIEPVPPDADGSAEQRDEEIRQMLAARDRHREQRAQDAAAADAHPPKPT